MDNNIVKKERSQKQLASDIRTSERMKQLHQKKLLKITKDDNQLNELIFENIIVDNENVEVNTAIKKRMGRPRKSVLCIEPLEKAKIVDGITVKFN